VEGEGLVELSWPVGELGFLPILQPFSHCSRTMSEAGTMTLEIQNGRIPICIKRIKSPEDQVSDLLNLIEETKVFHLSLGVTCCALQRE
jgi:hypothetical protein